MTSTTARAAASLEHALTAWRQQQHATTECDPRPTDPPGVNTDRRASYPDQ